MEHSIKYNIQASPCGCGITAITSGFQPDDGGSTPPARTSALWLAHEALLVVQRRFARGYKTCYYMLCPRSSAG